MMNLKSKFEYLTPSELYLDAKLIAQNDRLHGRTEVVKGLKVDTYALPALRSAVLYADCLIREPLHVEKGYGKDGSKYRPLRGHRRTLVVQELEKMDDEELYNAWRSAKMAYAETGKEEKIAEWGENETVAAKVKELRHNLSRIPAQVYEPIENPTDRDRVIHDKDTKGVGRTEVLRAVWQDFKDGYSSGEVITRRYQMIAEYTGNTGELNKAPNDPAVFNAWVKNKFRGTVENYMLGIWRQGTPEHRDAALRTALIEDGLLKFKDEKGERNEHAPRYKLTAARWNALWAALKEDAKNDVVNLDDKKHRWEKSPRVKALEEKYEKLDMGIKTAAAKDTRKSSEELTALVDTVQSRVAKNALQIAATGAGSEGFGDLDADMAALENKRDIVAANLDKIKMKALQAVLASFVNDSPADFERTLAKYAPDMEVHDETTPVPEGEPEVATK